MKFNINNREFRLKAAALLLAAVIFIGLIPESAFAAFTPKVSEAINNPEAYNLYPIYKWHRIDAQKDLPPANAKVPVLIIWSKNGTIYYGNGSSSVTYDTGSWGKQDSVAGALYPTNREIYPNPFDNAEPASSFYTMDKVSNWTMMNIGSGDSSNEGAARFRFWMDGNLISGYDDWDWEGERESSSHDLWTIYTRDVSGKGYGKGLGQNRVRIFHEVSGTDVGFFWKNNYIFGAEDSSYDYDQFVMYWGEALYMSAITDNYTIKKGMVMNIDDGVLIKDGVTLTVMPGGTLSVEGQLFNNGTIQNYGTVIVQPKSCISPIFTDKAGAGSIKNSGELVDTKAQTIAIRDDKLKYQKTLEETITSQQAFSAEMQTKYDEASRKKDEVLTKAPSGSMEPLQITLNRLQGELEVVNMEYEAMDNSDTTDEEKAAYKKEKITPLIEKYTELYKPVAEQEVLMTQAKDAKKTADETVELAKHTLEQIKLQIKELNELADSNTNVKERGEGNLIVMQDARIAFMKGSSMSFKEGASLVCNGVIVHPETIVLDDSRIVIRDKGALILQFFFATNITNVKDAKLTGQGTLNVTLEGLASAYAPHCITAKGDYSIRVDGVLRYISSPIYDVSLKKNVSVKEGRGKWSTANAPYTIVDEQGNVVTMDSNGNKSTTFKDGSLGFSDGRTGEEIIKRIDGATVVIKKDGSKDVTYPDRSYEHYYPSGYLYSARINLGPYQRGPYRETIENGYRILDYISDTPPEYADVDSPDVIGVKECNRDGSFILEYDDGRQLAYDKVRNFLYSIKKDGSVFLALDAEGNQLFTFSYSSTLCDVMNDGNQTNVEVQIRDYPDRKEWVYGNTVLKTSYK